MGHLLEAASGITCFPITLLPRSTMGRPLFLLDPDSHREASAFASLPRPWRLLRTETELASAVGGRTAALFVVLRADLLLAWLAGKRRPFRHHRLLVLERLSRARSEVLRGLFGAVVAPERVWRLLPRDELAAAISASNAADLIIGGVVDDEARVVRLLKGDLESLVVPLSAFVPGPGGPAPEPAAMAITDGGQTLRFGRYEAAVDAILYEHDRGFRARASARLRAQDRSLGGAIRRLRIQRGIGREDFPGVSGKEIARIERGQIRKPRRATLKAISRTLRVRLGALAEH
jgi:hypothetical protein